MMTNRKPWTILDILEGDFVPTDRPKKVGRYILGGIIGEGKCGTVREAKCEDRKGKVAVKCLVRYSSSRGRVLRQCFKREMDSLRRLRHPNIVSLYETMETTKSMYLVLEMVDGATLADLLSYRSLPEDEVQNIMNQLTSAVTYMHNSGIIHRDIKPANIMITSTLKQVKLIDFSLSLVHEPGSIQYQYCGTPVYSAPEIYSRAHCGPPADIWSLGVVMYEMLTGRLPFALDPPYTLTQLYGAILRTDVIPTYIPKECILLIRTMLQLNPALRPTSENIKSHSWISRRRENKSSNDNRDLLGEIATFSLTDIQHCTCSKLISRQSSNSGDVVNRN